jgi:hypothetical protein
VASTVALRSLGQALCPIGGEEAGEMLGPLDPYAFDLLLLTLVRARSRNHSRRAIAWGPYAGVPPAITAAPRRLLDDRASTPSSL